MKEAMWKADSSGDFGFVDSEFNAPQFDLGLWKPELWSDLIKAFSGEKVAGYVVDNYANEKTRFIQKHKTAILKEHESDAVAANQRIIVDNRQRKNTYPAEALIQFPG